MGHDDMIGCGRFPFEIQYTGDNGRGGLYMNERLERFLIAQQNYFRTAMTQIQSGQKKSHWMWFIFPQIEGLGYSETSRYYAIQDLEEAKEFLADSTLGKNLIEISQALLDVSSDDATEVMGWPDDRKLKSSMTLFALAGPHQEVFQKVLDKYFHGEKDPKTLDILKEKEMS
jgi:uncharacterized protein (DUF1810 family)